MLPEEELILLRDENAELRQLVAQLQHELGLALEQLTSAQARIAELEQQPHDPPPFVKPKRPKPPDPKPPRKKRPAKHNHGRQRMTPTRQVEHALERCPDCDYRLQ